MTLTGCGERRHLVSAQTGLGTHVADVVNAMAYEGLDAPAVSVVASLTHIRSRPWLEQMVARATRVDPVEVLR